VQREIPSRDKERHLHFLEKYTRWGALSPASCWSIPLFRADFLHFTSKIVEHSRYLLGVAGHRGELFLCSGYPDPTEYLRWGIAPHLSCARSRHSGRLLMHDACCDERRPDEAVGAGLWNAWDGAQYRDRLWRRGAEPGLSLPYQLDAAILPHARPSSSRSVHGLWRRREPRDDRSRDPARV
jgi:hypothetical protein